MKTSRRVLTAAALVAPLVALTPAASIEAVAPTDATVFVSEVHYDNASTDAGEAVEVFGPTCTDLTGWSIEFYRDSGTVYGSAPLSGFIPDLDSGFGVVSVDHAGIQNGPGDGFALLDGTGTVQQLFSYEGTFAPALGTSAYGLDPTEIPAETSATPVGDSIQLQGTGSTYGDFTWVAAPNSFGALGAITPSGVGGDPLSCDLGGGGGGPLADVVISELHYDNAGGDVNETVEVTGPAGTDLTGWTIALYNGSSSQRSVYGTINLSGIIPDEASGFGALAFPRAGIQNGGPDGLALVGPGGELVEFLSYEGSFEAASGPAVGVTSTDMVVAETSSTPADQSLQRNGDTWAGPWCASFARLNDPGAEAPCPEPPPAVLNAALISTTGSDDPEWVELFGTPGFDLDGLSVIGVESDDQSSNGNIDHRYDFGPGDVIGDNGFFLLGNPSVLGELGVTPNYDIPNNGLENSSITLALVETASITGTSAADVGVVLDSVGVWDSGALDSFAFGAPIVGPDGSFLPAGVRRIVDGFDTDSALDWEFLVYSPRDDAANIPTAGSDDGGFPDPTSVKIHEIQGSSLVSPLLGERVLIEGIVVGDHEGPAPALRGFFVQEEDADADSDVATSEGIFVFNFDLDEVNLGDHVSVEGTVVEFNGNTQLTDFVEVTVITPAPVPPTPLPLPTATVINLPVSDLDDLEAYEGMLTTFPQNLVMSEYFNYTRYGEVVVALPADGQARVMNPTAVYDPTSSEAATLADVNDRSRIVIDDGNNDQNPTVNIHPINRELLSDTNSFRGGDTVTGLTGPLFVGRSSQWSILPYGSGAGFDEYVRNEAPAAPDAVGGDLRVATLNALNYFVSLDTADTCGPSGTEDCRGADNLNEYQRQHVKLMNALVGLDADVVGMVELENTPGVEALAALVDGIDGPDGVDGLNDILGAGTYSYVAAGVDSQVGNDVIKVGVIYRPAAVTPLGDPAILDDAAFVDPFNVGDDKNRAAVAQTFIDNATGEVFSVVVNHFKSKGSPCGEAGEGGLTGSCNLTRTAAAEELANWIAGDPTGVDDDDWLILGDLNSYDKETPVQALQTAGFTDLINQYQGEYAYSYVFDGEVGYLDYVMSSSSMTSQVTGATEWHINADEAGIFDYDTNFRPPEQQAYFDGTTPFRSSDHDAALIGLSLDSFDATVVAIPHTLWAPNHKLYDIELVATLDSGVADTVAALSAISSEADSGLGDDDVPNDISIVEGDLQLRGERFSNDGRTYTIQVAVVSDGQTVVVEGVEVTVAHDQRAKRPRRNSFRVR